MAHRAQICILLWRVPAGVNAFCAAFLSDFDRRASLIAPDELGMPVAQKAGMKHILVADDNVAMAALVARALPGYKVTTAHNGLEALVLAKTLPNCDLVIADYLMPALTGAQLATRLRLERPSVKTLLITGHAAHLESNGADTDDRLAKPFHVTDLREKVARLIGRAES